MLLDHRKRFPFGVLFQSHFDSESARFSADVQKYPRTRILIFTTRKYSKSTYSLSLLINKSIFVMQKEHVAAVKVSCPWVGGIP